MPYDLNNKLLQVCDNKYLLGLTTQIILICPFANALCNIAKYFECLLQIQKYLLIQEKSESKVLTMNLPEISDFFFQERWAKMIA